MAILLVLYTVKKYFKKKQFVQTQKKEPRSAHSNDEPVHKFVLVQRFKVRLEVMNCRLIDKLLTCE
jgi:hypothetical protein